MKRNEVKRFVLTNLFWVSLCLTLELLAACTSISSSIKVTGEITPEPIIGQIVTLRIEAVSEKYSGEGLILITPFNNINIVAGELEWRGPVTAGEPFVYKLTFCITKPGQTGFYIAAAVETGTGENKLHIYSTADSAEVIPSSEYETYQPPLGSTLTPTPEPVVVSPECAGEEQ